jgi:NAD(P) transhydrogenase subunit beta
VSFVGPLENTPSMAQVSLVEHAVNPWVAFAYLVSGVLFILALRGLSSPATSRKGNRFGMAGMLIAVVTTLITHEIASLPEIIIAIAMHQAWTS